LHGARHAARWTVLWAVAAAASLLAGAAWLRAMSIEYLVISVLATFAALALATRLPRGQRRWAGVHATLVVLFCAAAAVAQAELRRIERDWPTHRERTMRKSAVALDESLRRLAGELARAAERALDAPRRPADAFAHLAGLARGAEERGLVLYRGKTPAVWGGTPRIATDSLGAPLGVAITPFYLALYAVTTRGDDRAVATAILHAAAPADGFAIGTDSVIAEQMGVRGFDFASPETSGEDGFTGFAPAGAPLFSVRPQPFEQGEVRLRIVEGALLRGVVILGLALACFVVAMWRRARSLRWRFAALAVALGCVAITPLNAFSNQTRLFDPALYFAPLGGALTASAGALALTSALSLLGLLALVRARIRRAPRWVGLVGVLLIAGLGPFLLRDLSRGIATPSYGVSTLLWLAWQVPLFLAGTALLLAVSSAGRVALGPGRGLPPVVAPALAAVAALLGPITWAAPGSLPEWYSATWIGAIAALAFTRPHRRAVLASATVASFGAAVLVWSATARQRVALAERDATGLTDVDPYAVSLLRRLANILADEAPPSNRALLLQRYVSSDLTAARYPMVLDWWAPGDSLPAATLRMAEIDVTRGSVADVVDQARRGDSAVLVDELGELTRHLILAVPHDGGGVTSVVVAPRTRLIPDAPFSALLGVAPDPSGETPYVLALAGSAAAPDSGARRATWTREGNELHGDWIVPTARGASRVHAEVELRPIPSLVQRGALVLLLNVAIVGALWGLGALSDGGFGRWLRTRRREWWRSYRGRLTLVLSAFFVIPAVAFALWSYRQLQSDDRRSRELLVTETLRAVDARAPAASIAAQSERLEAPLLLYRDGLLTEASDSLYEILAPVGRLLRPDVELRVGLADEVTASRLERVGPVQMLFGYRGTSGADDRRVVITAPARANELALDRRRQDLSILVLFATALGALAAVWLSGVAARQLARPIRELRRAALAIAAGDREPALPEQPPAEFLAVFAAFRRMAADLNESRSALEEAQRRTAAVLRNVASGVLAVAPDGSVTLANPRAEALLGAALAPGTSIGALGADVLAQRVHDFLQGYRDEEEFDVELTSRQLHGRLTRLTRGGGGAVLTLDDVTELARAQRVLAWGEMARQVAHEIKNPLTPIRLGVQHLKRARSDSRVDFDKVLDQNVTRILGEIDRLDEIARSFSRYGTAPGERAAAEPVDVDRVARGVVELETMGEGGVQWTVASDGPVMAVAVADELREVLLNVLENARLARARNVELRVARRGNRVAIVVEDDGEGIDENALPRVFEPHFSTRTSGSGLGLAISRRLIDGWGGAMTVASTRGEGTKVEILLVATEDGDHSADGV
jgi:signal transduction histidine kinase/HAMP domain-containing protein